MCQSHVHSHYQYFPGFSPYALLTQMTFFEKHFDNNQNQIMGNDDKGFLQEACEQLAGMQCVSQNKEGNRRSLGCTLVNLQILP